MCKEFIKCYLEKEDKNVIVNVAKKNNISISALISIALLNPSVYSSMLDQYKKQNI